LTLLAANLKKEKGGTRLDAARTPALKPVVFIIGDGLGTDEPQRQLKTLRLDACALYLCVLGPQAPEPSLLKACDAAVCAAKSSDSGPFLRGSQQSSATTSLRVNRPFRERSAESDCAAKRVRHFLIFRCPLQRSPPPRSRSKYPAT